MSLGPGAENRGTISHYRIIEKLRCRGMGVVYKTEGITLHRFVALTFSPDEVGNCDGRVGSAPQRAEAAVNLDELYDTASHPSHPLSTRVF